MKEQEKKQAIENNERQLQRLIEMKLAVEAGADPAPFINDLNETIEALNSQIYLFEKVGDENRRYEAHSYLSAVLSYKCLFLEAQIERMK